MTIEYYEKDHMTFKRKFAANKMQGMWLTVLTKHSTITNSDFQALEGLGIKLVLVDAPKEEL